MTQLEYAKNNIITPLMRKIAREEGVSPQCLLKNIKEGKAVILKNRIHNIPKPCGVGLGLRTKVNSNLGTSTDKSSLSEELKKLAISVKYGADSVMDLSVGGELKKIRKVIAKIGVAETGPATRLTIEPQGLPVSPAAGSQSEQTKPANIGES